MGLQCERVSIDFDPEPFPGNSRHLEPRDDLAPVLHDTDAEYTIPELCLELVWIDGIREVESPVETANPCFGPYNLARLRRLLRFPLSLDGEKIALDTRLRIVFPDTGKIDEINGGTCRPIEEPRDAGEFEFAERALEFTRKVVKGIPQIARGWGSRLRITRFA